MARLTFSRHASRVRERRPPQILGYSGVNAFTRFFTSMAGLSPSEWQSWVLAGGGLSLAFTPMRMTALLAQPTPSTDDRFLALSARSQGRSLKTAQGRLNPFAKLSGNDRCLRTAVVPALCLNGRQSTFAVGATGSGHPSNPRPSAAPPTPAGRFITTNPARSRCSTRRLATISAMISAFGKRRRLGRGQSLDGLGPCHCRARKLMMQRESGSLRSSPILTATALFVAVATIGVDDAQVSLDNVGKISETLTLSSRWGAGRL